TPRARRSSTTPRSSRTSTSRPTRCGVTTGRSSRRSPSTTPTWPPRSPTPTSPRAPSTCSTSRPRRRRGAPMAAELITLPSSSYDGERVAARDDRLRMDLDLGLRFTHVMGEDTRRSVFEAAVTVLALLEELKETGVIDLESYAARLPAQQQIGL